MTSEIDLKLQSVGQWPILLTWVNFDTSMDK